ncbi:hypothetical protein [Natrinema pallidum]|uniref:hypothetical protein n=1 Tax=Natrinema pallidum TaxID=69527 RepID=UPI001EE84592|nr:hypothetical protein [Natrinema pallidum]
MSQDQVRHQASGNVRRRSVPRNVIDRFGDSLDLEVLVDREFTPVLLFFLLHLGEELE